MLKVWNFLIYMTTVIIVRVFFSIFFEIEVLGSDKIPEDQGVIIACTHKQWLDIPLLAFLSFKKIIFISKKELWNNKWIAIWLDAVGTIPLDRKNPGGLTFKLAVDSLNNDHVLVIFPEGTRNKSGKLKQLSSGVALIAKIAKSNVVIVPVAIHYEKIKRFGLFKSLKVVITCAEGIDTINLNREYIMYLLKKRLESMY